MNNQEQLFTRNFVFMALSSFMMFMGFYLLMPVVAMYVIDEFGASPSMAGIVVSSYIITALLMRPFSGYFVDKFDRRKFYLLTLTIFTLLFLGYVFSRTIAALLMTRIALGATFAMVTTAASTLVIDIMPSARRGEGIGYFGAFTVLAMAVGPMVGLYLMDRFSYQGLFYLAFASSTTAVLLSFMVRTKPRAAVEHEPLSLDRFFLRSGLSMAIVMALIYFYNGTLMVYISLYVREAGLNVEAGNFFMLFAVGIIISRLFSGRLMRRGLYNEMLQSAMFIIIAASSLLILYLNDTTFFITSLLLGLGFGMASPVVQMMMVELVPHNRRGTANSTFYIALDLGSGIGMLLGGTIAAFGGYRSIYVVATGLVLLAWIIYNLYARGEYRRQLALSKGER